MNTHFNNPDLVSMVNELGDYLQQIKHTDLSDKQEDKCFLNVYKSQCSGHVIVVTEYVTGHDRKLTSCSYGYIDQNGELQTFTTMLAMLLALKSIGMQV